MSSTEEYELAEPMFRPVHRRLVPVIAQFWFEQSGEAICHYRSFIQTNERLLKDRSFPRAVARRFEREAQEWLIARATKTAAMKVA